MSRAQSSPSIFTKASSSRRRYALHLACRTSGIVEYGAHSRICTGGTPTRFPASCVRLEVCPYIDFKDAEGERNSYLLLLPADG